MREKINLPVAIPVWSLVTMVGGALFTAGTLYNQMNTLIESNKKSDERITLISEKQIGGLAALNSAQQVLQNHEARLVTVERALLDPKGRGK
jgi:hypothetical protein